MPVGAAGRGPSQAGATLLRATREQSIDPADDGLKPTNVPERSLRAALGYQVLSVPELTLSAVVVNEGSRFILPDNSASIPAWTRLDLAARLVQRMADYHADVAPGRRQRHRPPRVA